MDSGQQEARVVVGIDGSTEGYAALRWAVRAAARSGATLDVVHSWRAPEFEAAHMSALTPAIDYAEMGRALVAEQVEQALTDEPECGGIAVEVFLTGDAPKRAICERSEGAQLVVVGSRGRGAFEGMLSGSVSQYVSVHARCPVLIVR